MPLLRSRVPFTPQHPFRQVRPKTSKIIFLSCEGSVTEEEYFVLISDIYRQVKSKIQFISVAEDAVFTDPKHRTKDQAKMLSKVRPKHLVERIDQFKAEKESIYQFSKYPVSAGHPYEKTDHFRTRLASLGAPLKEKKHIRFSDYSDEKIKLAIHRAEELHVDKQDLCPQYFATTVYLLLQKIMIMLPEEDIVKRAVEADTEEMKFSRI